MAIGYGRWVDNEYVNWLCAAVALVEMKEGLQEFTDNQSVLFHKQLLRSFGNSAQACTRNCSSADIRKDSRTRRWVMTCSICDVWLQKIISYHQNAPFPMLHLSNTHPNLWQTTPWEVVKLFMPYGVDGVNSADAEIAGILQLFINCQYFRKGGHIGREDLLDELIDIRNRMMHSANLKVSDADLKDYLQTMLAFMQGMTGLAGSEKGTLEAAIDKVQQLAANQKEILRNEDLEIRTLLEKQVVLERDLKALVDKTQQEQDNQGTEPNQLEDILKEANMIEISVKKLQERQVELDKDLEAPGELSKKEQDNQTTEVNKYREPPKKMKALKEAYFIGAIFLVCLSQCRISKRSGDIHQGLAQPTKRLRTLEYQQKDPFESYARRMGERVTNMILETRLEVKQAIRRTPSAGTSIGRFVHETTERRPYAKGEIPSQSDLQEALLRLGKDSSDFARMYSLVKCYIIDQCDFIKDVRPSYLLETNEIVFVAWQNKTGKIDLPYKIFPRTVDEYSKEGAEITYCQQSLAKQFTNEESRQLTATLQRHTKRLMEKHSNIQMISACSVKSKMYGTDSATISPETCIVIYVDVKGIIPLLEEKLPTELDEFPVDVREGGVCFLVGKRAHEAHEQLKMGCQLGTSNGAATLGAFVEDPRTLELYCISCAHWLMNARSIVGNDGIIQFSEQNERTVYQPSPPSIFNIIGRVHTAVVTSGGGTETGIDVALISIESKKPTTGDFPESDSFLDAGFTDECPIKFSCGEVYSASTLDRLSRLDVVKFGAATGVTRGVFGLRGLSVRRLQKQWYDSPIVFELHNQIEVVSVGSSPFAKPGDSGSLVLAAHNGNSSDLRAVGILQGQTTNGSYIVTPMYDVLVTLGFPPQLKTFTGHEIQEYLGASQTNTSLMNHSAINNISTNHFTPELRERKGGLDQAISQEVAKQIDIVKKEFSSKLDGLDQAISQKVAKQIDIVKKEFSSKLENSEEQSQQRHCQIMGILKELVKKD